MSKYYLVLNRVLALPLVLTNNCMIYFTVLCSPAFLKFYAYRHRIPVALLFFIWRIVTRNQSLLFYDVM